MAEFSKKALEPLLSPEIENILNRSKGEEISKDPNIVTRSDDVFRYKHRIMKCLLGCEDLLRAIHEEGLSDKPYLNGDDFKDVCIFDYLRLPELQSETSNFVCFEINTSSGGDRDLIVTLIVRVVASTMDNKTDRGINRQDLMSMIISEKLDWSYIFGGQTFYKVSDTAGFHDKGFYYRDLIYRGTVANNYHSRTFY